MLDICELKNKDLIQEQVTDKNLLATLDEILSNKNIKKLPSPLADIDGKSLVSEKYLRSFTDQNKDNPRGVGMYSRMHFDLARHIPGKITSYLAENFFKSHSIFLSGYYIYEKGQSMAWHTNSDADGHRLYISYSDTNDKSFFRYLNSNNEVVTSYDNIGWTYRLFEIPTDRKFWHCVYSECTRYSIGFRIYNNLINN